ncbi:hypothetical protein MBLNU459_g6167t1 [Dothideomycetes sp. NU459]
MARQDKVARSVVDAILKPHTPKNHSFWSRLAALASAFFALFHLRLVRFRNDLFQDLRNDTWQIEEPDYERSFDRQDALQAKGDMGYSGSTFFTTKDGLYLIKSVPRRFEHSFFRDDLLTPYVEHMQRNLKSLLVRITDFVGTTSPSIGSMFGLAPTYHIVMENILVGQDGARDAGDNTWQTWDLKPTSYFFPERDIANGNLSSEATKSRLALDKYEDKIVLTRSQADEFLAQLENDTKVLEENNAVDYSLFLVRIPLSAPQDPFADDAEHDDAPEAPEHPPFTPPALPTWRTGIRSQDGKYVFRAVILDFFWAKHKVQAKLMTLLINAYNLIDKQGAMSITTTSEEYRSRFLKMCQELVEIKE